MANKGAYIIVGAQWGDEGKGLISAYLSARENAVMVARAGTGANAEHGIFLKDEKTYMKVNQLPLGWMMNPDCKIRIGSGVAVDPNKLYNEAAKYDLLDRVRLDYRSPIITPEHIEAEKNSKKMQAVGSTFSGTGHCKADFVLRKAIQAKDYYDKELLVDLGNEINDACKEGVVVVESSQGTMLSLALSPDYPNVTSDNVIASSAMDDVLLSWRNVKGVVLVVKAMPTREGAGSMGSSPELAPQYVKDNGMFEASSIGGVQRRKASGIDMEMLKYAVKVNGATQIALTFCEHYDPAIKNAKTPYDVTPKVWGLIHTIESATGVPVTILNTGKAYDNIVDLKADAPDWEEIDKEISKVEQKWMN